VLHELVSPEAVAKITARSAHHTHIIGWNKIGLPARLRVSSIQIWAPRILNVASRGVGHLAHERENVGFGVAEEGHPQVVLGHARNVVRLVV